MHVHLKGNGTIFTVLLEIKTINVLITLFFNFHHNEKCFKHGK